MNMISAQKSTVDSKMLNQIMSVFKQFEKKIDKLQDDVHYHGQTLTDLRIMVANLSGPAEPRVYEGKPEITKKTTAIQYYDEYAASLQEPLRLKRKTAMPPLVNKLKAKSFQGPKFGMRVSTAEQSFMNKSPSSPKGVKHSLRLPKADAPRKANTIRTPKTKSEKRRGKPKKSNLNALNKEKSN